MIEENIMIKETIMIEETLWLQKHKETRRRIAPSKKGCATIVVIREKDTLKK